MPSTFIAIGSILIVASLATATTSATTSSNSTFKKPYSGWDASTASTINVQCGVGTRILTFPSFNTTSGKGVAGGNATSRSCAGPPGPNNSGAIQELQLRPGFESTGITGLSGPVAFEVHWVLSFKGHLHIHTAGKGQFAEAIAEVGVTGYLYNGTRTAGSFTETGLGFLVNTSMSGTDVSISESKIGFTEYLNTTLSGGVTYNIYTVVDVTIADWVSFNGSSIAEAQLEMSGSAEGATLSWYSY